MEMRVASPQRITLSKYLFFSDRKKKLIIGYAKALTSLAQHVVEKNKYLERVILCGLATRISIGDEFNLDPTLRLDVSYVLKSALDSFNKTLQDGCTNKILYLDISTLLTTETTSEATNGPLT